MNSDSKGQPNAPSNELDGTKRTRFITPAAAGRVRGNYCHTHPAHNIDNSGNELIDILQPKGLTKNEPSKRTGPSAQNEPLGGATPRRPTTLSRGERVAREGAFTSRRGSGEGSPSENPALSLGERVGHDGVFSSRRGSGEGSLHCPPHPAQNTNNSRNELHDLLQSKALTTNAPSKLTISEAPNELLGGVNESVGPSRPIPEPAPHPSCSGWRKRRSPTPSPLGRGLLLRMGEMPATTSVAPIPPLRDRHAGLKPGATFVVGRVRGHLIATPTQHKTQIIVGTNSTIYCSQKL